MNVADRNQRITEYLEDFFDKAEKDAFSALDSETNAQLDAVFGTTVRGYREILLVIVIARLLNPEYKASQGFYDCNPRALYEGPIRHELLSRGIPHGKSGPLNVAKATIGINMQWAAQRRPAAVAKDVVSLVGKIESFDSNALNNFAVALQKRFLDEAQRIENLTVETSPEADPYFLSTLATQLISSVPDSGNTPQKIIGFLLQAYHDDLQSGLVVTGHEDGASVTNTTSQKPGDLTEELLDGTVVKIYEITVKPFTQNRIVESYQSVKAYDKRTSQTTHEVQVICRKEDLPEDVSNNTEAFYLGKVEYQDITYHFINIEEWIMAQLLRMSGEARLIFHKLLTDYIADTNTSESVKVFWKELHATA